MLPTFGFSVGDFFAGISLIRELIKALEDGAGASSDYRGLISELYGLERALLEVKAVRVDSTQQTEVAAIKQVATQCQETITDFLKSLEKYQPSLRAHGSGSSWRDGLRKMQWALFKKEDIQKFRA